MMILGGAKQIADGNACKTGQNHDAGKGRGMVAGRVGKGIALGAQIAPRGLHRRADRLCGAVGPLAHVVVDFGALFGELLLKPADFIAELRDLGQRLTALLDEWGTGIDREDGQERLPVFFFAHGFPTEV